MGVSSQRQSPQDVAFQRVKSGPRYGPRRLEFEMVPRGFLRARGLLRAHAGSSSKGTSRLFLSTEPGVEAKLEEYCAKVPAPLSIAEFTERGRPGMMSEAASYDHLVPEVITRLSHLITEIRNFPVELKEQEEYGQVVSDYMKTYSEAFSFEKRKSTPENILEAVEMLKVTKQRHSEVVPNMARACRAEKMFQYLYTTSPSPSLTAESV